MKDKENKELKEEKREFLIEKIRVPYGTQYVLLEKDKLQSNFSRRKTD